MQKLENAMQELKVDNDIPLGMPIGSEEDSGWD